MSKSCCLVNLVGFLCWAAFLATSTETVFAQSPQPAHAPFPRLPGDFEPQRALVISVSDWQPHHADVLRQIVAKTAGHSELLILYNDPDQLLRTLDWLKSLPEQCDHVRLSQLELDTIWLRDFAPLLAQTATGYLAIDFYYVGERPKDDRLPHSWAQRTNCPLVHVPWTLQGGNLLSNGRHLAITTERIFQDNFIQFPNPLPSTNVEFEGRKIVVDALTSACNLSQLVILEHLQSEATRHADIFAAFVAPNKIVVASVDPRSDPVNAAILDRNARKLQSVRVGNQPLEVSRLPIPPRNGQSWSAFANVIIANDVVLMPIYKTDPPRMIAAAKAVYQQLLPAHQVETVDITSFKQLQGELHCLSMNLPAYADYPSETMSYRQAITRQAGNQRQVDAKAPSPAPNSKKQLSDSRTSD